MTDATVENRKRPLSPHLQVYKPQMTSVMSILHRATGVALVFGLFMVAWWLIAAASGEDAFNTAMEFSTSILGRLMLFGWTFAMFYHLCNGIRHLFWDFGYLFKLKNAFAAGYVVLFSASALTLAAWFCAYHY